MPLLWSASERHHRNCLFVATCAPTGVAVSVVTDPMREELITRKEVANHLGVNVRTAQRWERERGLPVRRLPGRSGRLMISRAAKKLRCPLAAHRQKPNPPQPGGHLLPLAAQFTGHRRTTPPWRAPHPRPPQSSPPIPRLGTAVTPALNCCHPVVKLRRLLGGPGFRS
jgi:hypothetical protein